MTIKKFTKDILTGADNKSYDNGRILCVLSFIVYFGLAVVSVVNQKAWDPISFSAGVSTMAVAFGINLRLKRKTEPELKE